MDIIKGNARLLAFFLFSMLLLGCAAQTQGPASASSQGRVVVVASDAAADLGAVSKIEMTIDNVQLHSTAAAGGWTTVSSESRRIDLLQLKAEGSSVVLADAQVPDGTYDQIRMDVSNVVVTDASGAHDAVLPSSHLQIQTQLKVQEGSTSTANADFAADESLHITGNGKYILAPVVKLETRANANVQAGSNGRVTVGGGSVTSDQKVGMRADGNVAVGVGIPADAVVNIGSNGEISLGSILGGSSSGGSPEGVSIRLISMPVGVEANQPVTVRWSIATPVRTETTHTSVHFGYTSVPSNPTVAAYAYSTEYLTGTIPGEFSAAMTPSLSGTVYYRAHVVVDGVSYWTEERTMQVGPAVSANANANAGANGGVNLITGAAGGNAGSSAGSSSSGGVGVYAGGSSGGY
ncbi:MAG: DUF4382 domain-containing protein [Candidatus Micrarchaeia archaeon]